MKGPRLLLRPARIEHNGLVIRISPQEVTVLLAIMGRHWLPRDEAAELLWPHPDFMPDEWHHAIWVLISTLRTKLERFGWTIETRYGFGWKLERHAGHDGPTKETPWQATESEARDTA